MKYILTFLSIAILTALFFNNVNANESNSWLSDEILLQLQELRRDINVLKSRINALESENESLKKRIHVTGKKLNPSVKIDNKHRLGKKNAKVAVIEFSDYQCPFCKKHYNKTFLKLKENYIDTGKIQYVMYDYPLSFHPEAFQASLATLCSGNQGKYWEMHDALFENSNILGEKLYLEQAKLFGLNLDQFSSCIHDSNNKSIINSDINYGSSLGVSGTPAFFVGNIDGDNIINVKKISGVQSYKRFELLIDSLLNL